MIRFILAIALLFGVQAGAEPLKLAVTTSFNNSGLSDVLLPVIREDTGVEVQLLVVGTGQALRLGEAGDVDAILVHSQAAEQAFVAEGYGTHRTEIMYNDFVFVGPVSDPAMVGSAMSAVQALTLIAQAQPDFVSRGDLSGTHQKELALWAEAGLDVARFEAWYKSVGSGMGASLNTASGLEAYILSDRASWLNFKNKQGLALLYSGDPALFNQYAYLPVNAARHPHVNHDGAHMLEEWLTSAKAKRLIDGYRVGGEALFVFNAKARVAE